MLVLSSWTGRDRQRYDNNNFRLVSGLIKAGDIEKDSSSVGFVDKLEVLMVSSPNRHDLVLPKGGWVDDETILEDASREAIEQLKEYLESIRSLGIYKQKTVEDECLGGCKGYMFALEVAEELEDWPERENRERKWLNVKKVLEMCRYEWMQRALDEFSRVMGVEGTEEESA